MPLKINPTTSTLDLVNNPGSGNSSTSFPTDSGKSPIIWMANTDDQGVIAHEIFHTALNIMYWAGMQLNSETEEAFAYEVQHLTNSFYNQINKIQ